MRFDVPQFIDVEDKIFGPLSFRQFAYLAGGAGACYLVYKIVPGLLAWPIMTVLAAFSFALAFIKINEKPFIDTLEAGFRYVTHSKIYIWKREKRKKKKEEEDAIEASRHAVPVLTESKLHDISWGLDVLNQRAERGM